MKTNQCPQCQVSMVPDLTDIEGLRQHCPRCMEEVVLPRPHLYRCGCGHEWEEAEFVDLRECPECGLAAMCFPYVTMRDEGEVS